MVTSVGIVGSTGSIGTQTVDVVRAEPERYRVVSLAAGSNVDVLIEQVLLLRPEVVALADESKVEQLAAALKAAKLSESVTVLSGQNALAEAAEIADVTINGVVGFAGLPATLACLQSGKRLGLANKESLIAAGPVVQRARRTSGAELIPVDSEHAAIHQCLVGASQHKAVSRLQVTASGGPFRGMSSSELRSVTLEDALNHPTWSMGPKITVDSSTLMNKGFEVIEAHELFGRPAFDDGSGLGFDDIDVVVHPQSIVHSMVTFTDGSTLAQLSEPDMRLPISYALSYPDRGSLPFGRLDWSKSFSLEFEPPDRKSFTCLDLAFEAGRVGQAAPAWLNAANEVTVQAFLDGRIDWYEISLVLSEVMMSYESCAADTLDAVMASDASARRVASSKVREREKL